MSLLDSRLNAEEDQNNKPKVKKTPKKTKSKTSSRVAEKIEKEVKQTADEEIKNPEKKAVKDEAKAPKIKTEIDNKGSLNPAPARVKSEDKKGKSRDELRRLLNIVMKVHHELVNDPAFGRQDFDADTSSDGIETMKKAIEKKVLEIMDKLGLRLPKSETDDVIRSVIDETIGLGPLEKLTCDESITEIMTNGHDMVFIEQKGKVKLSDVIFYDEDHLRRVITKIVSKVGRRVDETSPLVDARLLDGSRVNAVIPPIAVKGSALTIRKFNKNPLRTSDLMKFNSFTPQMEEFMRICVRSKLNTIVSGGTGSGKTTLLNALSSFIPTTERIITIEDSAELQLIQDHVVGLETRPANLEGKGEISIRDLVKNAMRMRPDRLVVGEVRSGEALDMLQAMNTGNDGSMTTAHANSPKDLVARVETMVLMAGLELPVRAIRQQTAAAFDLVVQQSRLQDGSRKITNITEVLGMEGDQILTQDIFVFHQVGINPKTKKVEGFFTATGIRPSFADSKIVSKGYTFKPDFFKPDPRYTGPGKSKKGKMKEK